MVGKTVFMPYPGVPQWVLDQQRRMQEYFDAIYRAWLYEAVLSVAIELPLHAEIEILVGYNPQRLLAPPDRRRTFRERLKVWEEGGDLEAHGLRTKERSPFYTLHEEMLDALYPLPDLATQRRRTF